MTALTSLPRPREGGAVWPAPKASRTGWRLGRYFVLRVAGKPYAVADDLSFPQLAGWVASVLASEDRVAVTAEAVVAALEAAIERQPDGPSRGALIHLKRDVYNGRSPRPATVAATRDLLDPATAQLLAEWRTARQSLADIAGAGDDVLSDELAERRAAVRSLADDELRSAVLLQSPVLESQLDRYLRADGRIDKRARKVERTLLEFLYRASCKTSPFSTLTSVGLGEFAETAGASPLPRPRSLRKRSAVRLNIAVLARLSDAILARADLRSALAVRATSGWRAQRGRVRYVRRSAMLGDPGGSVTMDSVHESMFALPSGPALQELLTVLPEGHDASLSAVTDSLLAGGGRRRADVEAFLGHLIRLGLLVVPALHVDLRAANPLQSYRERIEDIGTPWSAELAERLRAAEQLVEAYPAADARARREVLSKLRGVLSEALLSLGGDDGAVPQTLVYEDTSIDSTDLRCDAVTWRAGIVADLAGFADVLPVFDVNLPRRLVTRGFFHARYGLGESYGDFQTFAHEFHRDFFDNYTQRAMRRQAFDDDDRYVAQENWFSSPEIAALDEARATAATVMARAYAALPEGAEGLSLDAGLLSTLRSIVPEIAEPVRSWSFFAQVASRPEDGAPGRLVLNRVYSGMTSMFSRFGHCLLAPDGTAAGDALRAELAGAAPAGVVLAELSGGYGTTNLNVHPAVTPYEIVCPGEVSSRAVDEQITIDDLVITDDPVEGRLRLMSRRLGCEVVPVYLGFLMPMALPELQQVLLCFSVTGMAQVDLWSGTGVAPPESGMVSLPRLVVGDVVVQRRQWKMSGDHFPTRASGVSDATYFAEVARWRRANALPRRVFAAVDGWRSASELAEQTGADQGDGPAGPSVSRKPLPVDFDSWFSVQLFEQVARGSTAGLVLTEALPDADELWLGDEHGRAHVSELTFELYAERGPAGVS